LIRATWRKSGIGYSEDIRAAVASLGFRKLNQTRELPDNPSVRGALEKLNFLISIEGQPWNPPKRSRYKIWRARANKKHARGH
jgi:large subunit ribosomal protein L30